MKHNAIGYWVEEAGEPAVLPALAGDLDADVVVVGAGFTGLWSAWHLAELNPEASIVMLEAGRAAHGPTGRNGGFANSMWFSSAAMRTRFGDQAALAIAVAAEEAVQGIGAFCEQHGVDAWFRPGGYLQVSTGEGFDHVWDAAASAARDLGRPDAVQQLSPEQVADLCRSPRFRSAALYPGSASVQPARLGFGLLERLRERGVRVFEGSPVHRVGRHHGGVIARTRAGTVRAGHAVVGVGCESVRPRWPGWGRSTIASSHIALTEPVPEVLEQIGWTGGECVSDSRALLHYFRTTPDGRIAFGWGGGRIAFGAHTHGRAEVDPDVIKQVVVDLKATFPELEGKRITHAWGGPIDASPSHLPIIRTLAGGKIGAAFGYTGNGVGPSFLVGRTLASIALERSDEYASLALIDPSQMRVPPEPLRWIGGTAIRSALVKVEAELEAGRLPRRISRRIAEIPKLIGFHIGR